MANKVGFNSGSPRPGPKKVEPMTDSDRLHNLRLDPTVQRQWVDAIQVCLEKDREKRKKFGSRWTPEFEEEEEKFIRNVDRYLTNGWALTEPMVDWLERIYQMI